MLAARTQRLTGMDSARSILGNTVVGTDFLGRLMTFKMSRKVCIDPRFLSAKLQSNCSSHDSNTCDDVCEQGRGGREGMPLTTVGNFHRTVLGMCAHMVYITREIGTKSMNVCHNIIVHNDMTAQKLS